MYEQRLVFALCKVNDAHEEREGLERGGRGGCVVDVGSEEVDEWVDEQRAEVFDDEDGAPGYLRT